MDEDDFDSCTVCREKYDENIRPRTLPCGHTFCGGCLKNSVKFFILGTLTCPHCQKSHPAASAEVFPIRYTMEEMIANFRKAMLGAVPKNKPGSIKSSFQGIFSNQKDCLTNLVQNSEDMRAQLLHYEEFLLERKTKHESVISQIYELAHQHETVVQEIIDEHSKLDEYMDKGNALRDKASGRLLKYKGLTVVKDIVPASEDLEKCHNDLEIWKNTCQMQLPNVQIVRRSEKILEKTTQALTITEEEGEDDWVERRDVQELNILDKLNIFISKELTLESLQKKSASVKELLERELVYAVQKKEGQIRSAKVSVKDGRTFLHHLQDGEPPPYAHTIQHSCLTGTLKMDSVTAFFDLFWNGTMQGRVFILLSPETSLGYQFRLLCTGELGPSYAQSRFLKVNQKGSATGECVYGGDYEKNDGSGGAPLLQNLTLDGERCRQTKKLGLVWHRFKSLCSKSSQFGITIGTGSDTEFVGVFGQVLVGMNVLRAAAQVDDIGSVLIHDCGVVIPL